MSISYSKNVAAWRAVVAVASVLLLQACATPGADRLQVTSSYVTNGGTGPRFESVPMSVIQQKDTLYVLTHVHWEPVDSNLGKRPVTWNWYSASGELVATRKMDLKFDKTPYRFWYKLGAANLPVGKYRVEVLVDERKLSAIDFSIAP